MNNDTIAAIATPHGVGGIAVLRLSGCNALQTARVLTHRDLSPNRAQYVRIENDGKFLDDGVATYFAAPHSYTGEDVVEISCHGSLYVQQELLQACIRRGARLAEPGDFTLRAFMNGKMDLAQSEAVADLIDATSEAQHRLATNQLRGGFSIRLAAIRDHFVQLTSLLELELDFSDEDVEFADRGKLFQTIAELEGEITTLVESFKMGNAIRQGVPVAIVGRPNVGKSTLLNALLNDERAIVSDIPGTTRDTIEDTMVLKGITFRFIDTAGIRESRDTIEMAGIERSFQSIEKAQIVIYVTDSPTAEDFDEFRNRCDLSDKRTILVTNKCDIYGLPASTEAVPISAKTGEGLERLKDLITDSVAFDSDSTMLTNARHHEAMTHILESLRQAKEGIESQLPADLVVIDIREALYHLGLITGQVTSDEVLGSIFSRFCIGK